MIFGPITIQLPVFRFFRFLEVKMKKRTLIYLLLIVLCGAVFFGYRAFSQMNDDHTIPTIKIDESITDFSIREDRSQLLQGVSAADETDGDVTASLLVEQVILTDSRPRICWTETSATASVPLQSIPPPSPIPVSTRWNSALPILWATPPAWYFLWKCFPTTATRPL